MSYFKAAVGKEAAATAHYDRYIRRALERVLSIPTDQTNRIEQVHDLSRQFAGYDYAVHAPDGRVVKVQVKFNFSDRYTDDVRLEKVEHNRHGEARPGWFYRDGYLTDGLLLTIWSHVGRMTVYGADAFKRAADNIIATTSVVPKTNRQTRDQFIPLSRHDLLRSAGALGIAGMA